MTIDQMIERLQELKAVTGSGETLVCIPTTMGCSDTWDDAACELQNVKIARGSRADTPIFVHLDDDGDFTQIVSIF